MWLLFMFTNYLKLCVLFLMLLSQVACASPLSIVDRVIVEYVPNRWGNLEEGWQQVDNNIFLGSVTGIESRMLKKSKVLVFSNQLSSSMIAIIFDEPKAHPTHCNIRVSAFTAPTDLSYRIYLKESHLVSFDNQLLKNNCEYRLEDDFSEFIFMDGVIADELIKELFVNASDYQKKMSESLSNCVGIKNITSIGSHRFYHADDSVWRNAFYVGFEDVDGYSGVIDLVLENNQLTPIRCATGAQH